HSLTLRRRLRQARAHWPGRDRVGKIALRMAPRLSRRRRDRQNCRTRKEARAGQASRGAKIFRARRQTSTTIERMREIRIPAFAKVNLWLDVLGKRADGYHELRTIFQTVSLRDELRMRAVPRPGISLTISGNDALSRESI